MEKAFSDKNLYDKGQYRDLFPKTLLRNINGILYDSTYAPIVVKDPLMQLLNGCDEVIVKPSIDSGGGRSVELFVRNDDIYINHKGHVLSLAHLNQIFEKNYILQEKLTQHESLSRFNQSSVNTIRVFTYRSVVTEKVVALHAVLRIGREGSVVDNQASGGISVGIDNEGVLNKYAIDKMGNKYYRIGTIDLQHTYKLIKFAEMIELARKIATDYLYTRMLGFDITLDSDQAIRIIEINNGSIEINFHQMNSGPLFGCYTEEVIDYCVKNKLGEEAIA
ncbi:MAG: hypothetical protein JXA82_01500 [Sedimentisphaerales bacterium]|nr:hypothetical protein [Sedimentisphaerales bacterium]